MQRQACLRTLCVGVLCTVFATTLPAALVSAQPAHKNGQGARGDNPGQQRKYEQQDNRKREERGNHKQREGGQKITAEQAARQAQQRYGGRVLKVDPRGSGYSVRLLQDDGRVITAVIGD